MVVSADCSRRAVCGKKLGFGICRIKLKPHCELGVVLMPDFGNLEVKVGELPGVPGQDGLHSGQDRATVRPSQPN